jgi:hypothetical protein
MFNASVAAATRAAADGLGDLREYTWEDQPKRMRDPGRRTYAYDHYVPVSELHRALDALEEPTEAQVNAILSQASVVWLLREENKRLDKTHRSRRPDPRAAYAATGIRLAYPWPAGFPLR